MPRGVYWLNNSYDYEILDDDMSFLLPKQLVFFDLIIELNTLLRKMVTLLVDFSKKYDDFEKYTLKAEKIEHEADAKAHEIVQKLNKTFITPIDREDIFLLTHELDDIIDLIENVISNIYLYKITKKPKTMDKFVPLIVESSKYLEELLLSLKAKKYSGEETHQLIVKIHELEDDGDFAFHKSIEELFEKEKNPMTVVKLKELYEGLEYVMDKYQHVSDIIEGIMVKQT